VPGADRNLQLPTNTGQVTEVVGFGNDALERETKSSEFNEIHCVPKATLSRDCWRKITPPLLLWAIWRLGYDRRGWLYQTLTAWVVVPVNYFWRPQFDVNWARGPFFREQHTMPGLLYLLGYLVVVPLVVYFPTHLLLQWWARRGGFLLAGGRRKQ